MTTPERQQDVQRVVDGALDLAPCAPALQHALLPQHPAGKAK